MIDPGFPHVGWDEHARQLNALFSDSKEEVYLELYKETLNARNVLSRKFDYLSKAYWVFIAGLMIPIIAFVIVIEIKR